MEQIETSRPDELQVAFRPEDHVLVQGDAPCRFLIVFAYRKVYEMDAEEDDQGRQTGQKPQKNEREPVKNRFERLDQAGDQEIVFMAVCTDCRKTARLQDAGKHGEGLPMIDDVLKRVVADRDIGHSFPERIFEHVASQEEKIRAGAEEVPDPVDFIADLDHDDQCRSVSGDMIGLSAVSTAPNDDGSVAILFRLDRNELTEAFFPAEALSGEIFGSPTENLVPLITPVFYGSDQLLVLRSVVSGFGHRACASGFCDASALGRREQRLHHFRIEEDADSVDDRKLRRTLPAPNGAVDDFISGFNRGQARSDLEIATATDAPQNGEMNSLHWLPSIRVSGYQLHRTKFNLSLRENFAEHFPYASHS